MTERLSSASLERELFSVERELEKIVPFAGSTEELLREEERRLAEDQKEVRKRTPLHDPDLPVTIP